MLRGLSIKKPEFYSGPMPDDMKKIRGYSALQTFFPSLTSLNPAMKDVQGEEVWMDHAWRVVGADISGGTGPCTVKIQKRVGGTEVKEHGVFLKTTHLLDPVHWIRGEYSLPSDAALPGNQKTWATAWKKIHDPWNQAYVESVASYAVGRLREEGVTPHFNMFYGSFCAKAATYRYNLTEDFYSYRNERWFWKGYDKSRFKLFVRNRKNSDAPVPQDVQDFVFEAQCDSGYSSSVETGTSEEELDNIVVNGPTAEGSIHSADSMSEVSYKKDSDSCTSSESKTSFILDSYEVYAEITDYPVMLIFTEKNEGTMDELLMDVDKVEASPGTVEWEERWTAWLFQIVAALTCVQKIIGLTHNDLHTNNIVWASTTEEFLYYRTGAGVVYRVPTFGKIFKIIDFGRAIFTINDEMFISDDFRDDNDAGDQYHFSPLSNDFEKEIPPNPSFDLCRLAVSLLDIIFPIKPDEVEDGDILSSEKGLVVRETVSELYNLLWSFMIDDAGKNVFMNPDESERFPNFDLYKHTAEWVHCAVPSEQVAKPIFASYVCKGSVDASVKVYPLFC
jgi:hypothetical protein